MRCSHDGDWYKIVNDFHSNALITSTSIWPSVSWLGCILTTDRFCAASSSKRVSTYGISLASQIFIAWAAAGDHSGPKMMPTRSWTGKRIASFFLSIPASNSCQLVTYIQQRANTLRNGKCISIVDPFDVCIQNDSTVSQNILIGHVHGVPQYTCPLIVTFIENGTCLFRSAMKNTTEIN